MMLSSACSCRFPSSCKSSRDGAYLHAVDDSSMVDVGHRGRAVVRTRN